jgi:uncharacterized protein (DUF488 family)
LHTVGHGRRPVAELLDVLQAAGVRSLVDVRRFPFSRRNPQFNRDALVQAFEGAGIRYRHEVELGGMLTSEPGEERFACIETPAFRAYAARMTTDAWQRALERALTEPALCFMCAETPWEKCHRRYIAEVLHARGHEVRHLIRRGETEPHVPSRAAESRAGRLYLCGELVA